MKRAWIAVFLIALMIFFGVSGEKKTVRTADELESQAEKLYELCSQYGGSAAERSHEMVKRMYEDWKKARDTLTLYMNNENLRAVTNALREVMDSASSGDIEQLDISLRRLSYAIDDLRDSEKLNLYNVF